MADQPCLKITSRLPDDNLKHYYITIRSLHRFPSFMPLSPVLRHRACISYLVKTIRNNSLPMLILGNKICTGNQNIISLFKVS